MRTSRVRYRNKSSYCDPRLQKRDFRISTEIIIWFRLLSITKLLENYQSILPIYHLRSSRWRNSAWWSITVLLLLLFIVKRKFGVTKRLFRTLTGVQLYHLCVQLYHLCVQLYHLVPSFAVDKRKVSLETAVHHRTFLMRCVSFSLEISEMLCALVECCISLRCS